MAKEKAKKTAAKKAKAKRTPPPLEMPDFGVAELAKHMDLEEATVRAKLRSAGIKKKGRVHDFGSKAGMEKVAKQIASD